MKKYRTKLILISVFLVFFIVIAALALSGTIADFELSVYNTIAKSISPVMTSFVKVVTYAGSFTVVCILSVLLIIIPQTRKKFGFPAGITAGLSALANLILKQIFQRARPDVLKITGESGYSFPSGHTQGGTAFFVAIALVLLVNVKNKKVLIPALIFCFLIPIAVGLSRIYLGVHHAGDVLAGWAAGAIMALLMSIVWQVLDNKLKKYSNLHHFFFGGEEEAADCRDND